MDIVATGFVADTSDLASDYPSAGGDSSEVRFQAIYWRCIAAFLFSAVVNAPHCRPMLFSNIAPPTVDGINLGAVFDRLGVTIVRIPLTHRLPQARKWGNVFYFMDILKALPDAGRFALFDSDVVLAGPAAPLMARVGDTGMVGYRVDTPPDEDVNGLTMRQAARLAETMSNAAQPAAIPHIGGELLGIDLARREEMLRVFDAMWQDMLCGRAQSDMIRTEEHFWSIAAAVQGWAVGNANDQLKRLWTARNYRTVQPGDEHFAAWHLPAEKRYGFVTLFNWMVERQFDPAIDTAMFRAVLQDCFGIPCISTGKMLRDFRSRAFIGLNRVRTKLVGRC